MAKNALQSPSEEQTLSIKLSDLDALVARKIEEAAAKKAEAAIRVDDGKVARIPKTRILAELERKPEDDVFYVMGFFNSYGGKITDEFKTEHPRTRHITRMLPFEYEFYRHFSLGADLRDDKGDSKFQIGRMKISDQQNVRIDAESFGDLYIGPKYQKLDEATGKFVPTMNRSGAHTVKDILETVAMFGPEYLYDGKSFPIPAKKWMSEAVFLAFMKTEYEKEWKKLEAEEEQKIGWELASPAERKLGRQPAILTGATS